MSFTKTLTGIVAALYLGMGSAGAEEPEKRYVRFLCSMAKSNPTVQGTRDFYAKHNCQQYEGSGKSQKTSGKTAEQHLSCGKEWSDLLSIDSIGGSDELHHLQLEYQLSKSSSVKIWGVAGKQRVYGTIVTCVSKQKAEKVTCFYTEGNKLYRVNVRENPVFGDEIDLSNPRIRQAAERKFCGYVKQAWVKYYQIPVPEPSPAKKSVQEQLELLK